MNSQSNQTQKGQQKPDSARGTNKITTSQHCSASPETSLGQFHGTAKRLPTVPPNMYVQASRNLFDSLRATNANLQRTSEQQDDVNVDEAKQHAAAETSFRPESFDHMVGGGEAFDPLEQDPSKWGWVESLGGLETDSEFRDFVKDVQFKQEREGEEPSREDLVGTVNYANKLKREWN